MNDPGDPLGLLVAPEPRSNLRRGGTYTEDTESTRSRKAMARGRLETRTAWSRMETWGPNAAQPVDRLHHHLEDPLGLIVVDDNTGRWGTWDAEGRGR